MAEHWKPKSNVLRFCPVRRRATENTRLSGKYSLLRLNGHGADDLVHLGYSARMRAAKASGGSAPGSMPKQLNQARASAVATILEFSSYRQSMIGRGRRTPMRAKARSRVALHAGGGMAPARSVIS